MKFLPAQLMYLSRSKRAQRDIRSLVKFLLFLSACILVYSVFFHLIMQMEGKEHSFITGLYWTLTVMSTLGFGDITFSSDLGKLFSLLVLMSGIIFLLIMLPFTFIQFFYAPFLEAQSTSRVPKTLPKETAGHIIIIGFDSVARSLAEGLERFKLQYAILVPDVQQALELLDQDYNVVLGDYDSPSTYLRLHATQAAMIVALSDDMKNTNAVYTIREVAPDVPVVANAELEEAIDILQLAGATHVFQFMKMLGETLAQRTISKHHPYTRIGNFDELLIAEARATHSCLVGQEIRTCGLRKTTGLNIVGLLEKGRARPPLPDDVIKEEDVLLLAGSRQQLAAFEQFIDNQGLAETKVLVIGGGRVGQATVNVLQERGREYRVVEKHPRIKGPNLIHGDASDFNVLVQAGIKEASAVIITTHTDDLNIYLTIYCRSLRPDIKIISRATMGRNISALHKAGADFVMSHAALAVNTLINLLHPDKIFTLTEGLDIFKVRTPKELAGKSLAQSDIRADFGLSVVAVFSETGLDINPSPDRVLLINETLVLIGSTGAQKLFLDKYPEGR